MTITAIMATDEFKYAEASGKVDSWQVDDVFRWGAKFLAPTCPICGSKMRRGNDIVLRSGSKDEKVVKTYTCTNQACKNTIMGD